MPWLSNASIMRLETLPEHLVVADRTRRAEQAEPDAGRLVVEGQLLARDLFHQPCENRLVGMTDEVRAKHLGQTEGSWAERGGENLGYFLLFLAILGLWTAAGRLSSLTGSAAQPPKAAGTASR